MYIKKRIKVLQRLLSTVIAVCCILTCLPMGSIAHASVTTDDIPDVVAVDGVEYYVDPFIKNLYKVAQAVYIDNYYLRSTKWEGADERDARTLYTENGVPSLEFLYSSAARYYANDPVRLMWRIESYAKSFDEAIQGSMPIFLHYDGVIYGTDRLAVDGAWKMYNSSNTTSPVTFYVYPAVGICADYLLDKCNKCVSGKSASGYTFGDSRTGTTGSARYGPYRHTIVGNPYDRFRCRYLAGTRQVDNSLSRYTSDGGFLESAIAIIKQFLTSNASTFAYVMTVNDVVYIMLQYTIMYSCIGSTGHLYRCVRDFASETSTNYYDVKDFSTGKQTLVSTDGYIAELSSAKIPVVRAAEDIEGVARIHSGGYVFTVDSINNNIRYEGICYEWIYGKCDKCVFNYSPKWRGKSYGTLGLGRHAVLQKIDIPYVYDASLYSNYGMILTQAGCRTCSPEKLQWGWINNVAAMAKLISDGFVTAMQESCTFNDEGYCIYCGGKKPEPPVIEQVDPWANHSLKTDFINGTHVDTSEYNFQYVPNDQLSEYDFSDTRSVAVRFYKKDPVTGKIEYFSEAPMEFDIGLQMKAPVTLEGVTGDTAYNRGYVWEIEGKDFTHEANNTNMTTNRLLDWGLLPDTGGIGTTLLSAVGSALITTSTILWRKRKRSLN